ncbi:MAG: TlpA disulfide reductase family protein [Acidobacteria bacterium]|nr:TlpA disulfide reductase family protein [Acidobacteriota bacterium]
MRVDVLRLALKAALAMAVATPTALALDSGETPASGEAPALLLGVRLGEFWSDLEVCDLDGRAWTASDFADRVVLLDFWASWCAPCLADFPHLERAKAAYADRGLVIVSVSLDRFSRRDLRSFGRRQGITWPVLFDGLGGGGAVARRFQVDYPPRSLLFDRDGRLVALDPRGATLDAALRVLFATE